MSVERIEALDDTQSSQKLLRQALHDMSGPLNTANGFSEELRFVRELSLSLISQLPEALEPALRDSLSEQVDVEMNHCLNRLQESLLRLDSVLDRLRTAKS